MLLRNGLLKAERGDVVLFTNTSAEHPATYDFMRKIKRATEKEGIPFFIAQWHTVETVVGGEWRRRPTYRLANHRPQSNDNPWGYSHRGEVFKEVIAWKGMLPSVHTRVCTTLMKMFVTREFLSDWLAMRHVLPEQGHRAKKSLVDPKRIYRIHRANRGTMTYAEMKARIDDLSKQATMRPVQRLKDYTKAPLPKKINEMVAESVWGDRCFLFGDRPAPFLTFLGFRSGEDTRYQRMVRRNMGEATPGHDTQPPGEHSYAPLFNLDIDQEQVLDFWNKQPGRLRPHLPTDQNLSNCVYCFLKGPAALSEIERNKREFTKRLPKGLQAECRKRNTPNSLEWWAGLEEKYARNSRKANGDGFQSFGMFGLKDMSYRMVQADAKAKRKGIKIPLVEVHQDQTLSCECTD